LLFLALFSSILELIALPQKRLVRLYTSTSISFQHSSYQKQFSYLNEGSDLSGKTQKTFTLEE
jgi:hypothetical protein